MNMFYIIQNYSNYIVFINHLVDHLVDKLVSNMIKAQNTTAYKVVPETTSFL